MTGCLSTAFVAYIIPMATLNTGARYFSMMLMPIACSKCLSSTRLRFPQTHHRIQRESPVLTP